MNYKEMLLKDITKLIEKYNKLIEKNNNLSKSITYKGEEYISYEDAQEAYGVGSISRKDFEELSKLFDEEHRNEESKNLKQAIKVLFDIKYSIGELKDVD